MAVYYVRPTGSDTHTGLGSTAALAWQTINKATTTAVAGDVVNIMAGTYTATDSGAGLRTHNSGSAGSPITFQRYSTNTVVIRGQTYGIYLANNYITIDGLRFINTSQSAGMTHGCTAGSAVNHIIIKNCIFRNMTTGDPSFGIDWQYVTDGKIQNCTIDHIGTAPQPGPESGNGIGLAGGRNLVENCTIDYCGHCCVFATGASGQIAKHIIRNNTLIGTWGVCGEFLEYGTTSNPCLVENNVMQNTTMLEDGLWCNPTWQQEGSRTIFRRNRIYNGLGAGVQFYSNTNYQAKYNRFYHNIIYNCGYGKPTAPGNYTRAPYEMQEDNDGTMSDNIIKNSIHYLNGNSAYATYAGFANAGDVTFSNCTWNTTNPLFVLAPTNFNIQTGSPCANTGGWLTTITSASGSGTSFTVADPYYLCDGWALDGVSGDEIQIQGQTGTVRITAVSYTTNVVTVASSVTWIQGNGIAIGLTL